MYVVVETGFEQRSAFGVSQKTIADGAEQASNASLAGALGAMTVTMLVVNRESAVLSFDAATERAYSTLLRKEPQVVGFGNSVGGTDRPPAGTLDAVGAAPPVISVVSCEIDPRLPGVAGQADAAQIGNLGAFPPLSYHGSTASHGRVRPQTAARPRTAGAKVTNVGNRLVTADAVTKRPPIFALWLDFTDDREVHEDRAGDDRLFGKPGHSLNLVDGYQGGASAWPATRCR